ncbi:EAL domain-containing protein [Solimonas terrae]|uniref:cyclic-guanylate-specific phosphodiesterase n=1 Tax=Solimonas terrae TaxID=1396819 RepID=A0A6M2BQP3_9GAMM|nr:EAL domain-containing protein [Solimonas terrae]NGY04778.1 EAL domain-containing protein [Solimonas terrae]
MSLRRGPAPASVSSGHSGALRTDLAILLVAAAYFASGRIGLLLAIPPGYATAVWPASGIALACILVLGRRVWPGVCAGSFLINVWTSLDPSAPTALLRSLLLPGVIACGAAAQALIGAALIRRFVQHRNIFEQEFDVIRLLALGGPLACLTAASIGVGSLWLSGQIDSGAILFSWWTWWSGDVIGVLVFTPVVLVWAVRPYRLWLRRQLAITLPLLMLFTLVVTVFVLTSAREDQRLRSDFDNDTNHAGQRLQVQLDRYTMALAACAGLFTSSDSVTAAEFDRYAGMLFEQTPGLFAVSWNAVVREDQRVTFEQDMRRQGFGDFRIYEVDAGGRTVPALARPEHIVVTYVRYSAPALGAQGLDVSFNADRRNAFLRAAQTGSPVATPQLKIIGDLRSVDGLLMVLAVRKHERVLGYATLVVRSSDLFDAMLGELSANGIGLRVVDHSGDTPQLMFEAGAAADGDRRALRRTSELHFAGRNWTLQYSQPGSYLVGHSTWQAWLVLAGGMLLTALLGVLMLVMVGRNARIERLVRERTGELMASEERFRSLLESAPDAMVIVAADGRIVLVNSQTESLFGYTREELLSQPVELLLPQRFHEAHPVHRAGYAKLQRARPMAEGKALCGRRRDGSEFFAEVSLSPLLLGQEHVVTAAIRDVTGRKQAEDKLNRAHSVLAATLESTTDGIVVVDLGGRMQHFNRNFVEMWGLPESVAAGGSDAAALDAVLPQLRNPQAFIDRVRELYADRNAESFDLIELKDGRVFERYSRPQEVGGEIAGRVWSFRDITQRRSSEARIRHLAQHDALTNLPNRSLLSERLESAISSAGRGGHQLGVMLLDIDHFKRINDSLGHETGDELLQVIANRLRECTRKTDTVARLGGDEFVVLLSDIRDRGDVAHVAGHIVRELSLPIHLGTHELSVTPSIGVSTYPDDARDATGLIKCADMAMYHAKSRGRGNWQWYHQDLLRANEEHLSLDSALHRAMERNELSLHYQPVLAIGSGRIVGMEALLRWNHPERGPLLPSSFVGIAEESGLIVPIGEWALQTACRETHLLQQQTGVPLMLAVNVSPRQFRQQDLVKRVSAALNASGLSAHSLTLEITENLLLVSRDETIATLQQLRELGVSIAIDDFGTGYSSLSYLTRFPVNKLKIDGSFIRDLAEDSRDAAVVSSIIAIARSLQMTVVAEGVETPGQLAYLRERGCDEVQGFLVSEAVPYAAFAATMDEVQRRGSSPT